MDKAPHLNELLAERRAMWHGVTRLLLWGTVGAALLLIVLAVFWA
ncbi:MAG TPA: hypothetical protein VHL08_02045 [Dongiaceae bacterium]|jgi:hypothetical protein|nr:hypothetical protein [Dongiaceae bacterium]